MKLKLLAVYTALFGAALGVFFAVRAVGEALPTTTGAPVEPARSAPMSGNALFHVLLALLAVLVVARGVGVLFKRIGQPAVIGEVVAGLLLGPSFLGHVAPGAYAYLMPPSVAPALGVVAQVGVILYMFVIGLEVDMQQLKSQSRVSFAISNASMVVPFSFGAVLALGLFRTLAPPGVPFTVFALFMGVSMSVTAFPVLARILSDSGLQRSRLGTLALACASIGDVSAWCLLAFVVGVVEAHSSRVFVTLGLTAAYIAVMLTVVRPLVKRFAKAEELSQGTMAIAFAALLASALLTEAIGIHALFGAFLLGAIVPHDSPVARKLSERLEGLVVVLLLPSFFALTGLRTEVGLLNGPSDWLVCGAIIAIASAGKLGGTTAAARLMGLSWRDAGVLGVLMNTRGLMELIVLNVGLDLGVISPRLFAMLVIMAIVTTMATAPILRLLKVEQAAGVPADAVRSS